MAERFAGRRSGPSAFASAAARDGVVASRCGVGSAAECQTLGRAFEIDDLRRAGQWADRRGLYFSMQLDHVANGVAFEEVLCLTAKGQTLRSAAIWRSGNGVVLHRTGERPYWHRTLAESLARWEQDERQVRRRFWRG